MESLVKQEKVLVSCLAELSKARSRRDEIIECILNILDRIHSKSIETKLDKPRELLIMEKENPDFVELLSFEIDLINESNRKIGEIHDRLLNLY